MNDAWVFLVIVGPLGFTLWVLAIAFGAIATLIVVALFATSNDFSLRALGTRQWKQLQRWNYAAAALVALHAFAYQGIEKQRPQFVAVVIACVAITLAIQWAGFLIRRTIAAQRV